MLNSYPPESSSHTATDEKQLGLNGQPSGWHNPQPREPYHLLVIGAGPAGLMAARTAAALGARVALIERHLLGGLALNYSAIPSQSLIRTSRLYAEMRNAEAYGARTTQPIAVDFPLVMERMRRVPSSPGSH